MIVCDNNFHTPLGKGVWFDETNRGPSRTDRDGHTRALYFLILEKPGDIRSAQTATGETHLHFVFDCWDFSTVVFFQSIVDDVEKQKMREKDLQHRFGLAQIHLEAAFAAPKETADHPPVSTAPPPDAEWI